MMTTSNFLSERSGFGNERKVPCSPLWVSMLFIPRATTHQYTLMRQNEMPIFSLTFFPNCYCNAIKAVAWLPLWVTMLSDSPFQKPRHPECAG